MDSLPIEIIYNILNFLEIIDIYQRFGILNKEYNMIVKDEKFINKHIRLKYPSIYGLKMRTSEFENLKMIYKVMESKINPKKLRLRINNARFDEKALVLPYNVISKLLKLPELENMYTEIMGYLRCDEFDFRYLKDFHSGSYRVTFFLSLRNNEILSSATFRQELNLSFNQLMKDIVPINIKDENQFINEETLHAITLVIQPDYQYKMYYSSLNHFRENIVSLFKDVKDDYRAKYISSL